MAFTTICTESWRMWYATANAQSRRRTWNARRAIRSSAGRTRDHSPRQISRVAPLTSVQSWRNTMSSHPVTQPSADRHSAVTQPSLNRIPTRHSAATTPSLNRWLTAQRRFKQGFSAGIYQEGLSPSALILQLGLQHRLAACSAPAARDGLRSMLSTSKTKQTLNTLGAWNRER